MADARVSTWSGPRTPLTGRARSAAHAPWHRTDGPRRTPTPRSAPGSPGATFMSGHGSVSLRQPRSSPGKSRGKHHQGRPQSHHARHQRGPPHPEHTADRRRATRPNLLASRPQPSTDPTIWAAGFWRGSLASGRGFGLNDRGWRALVTRSSTDPSTPTTRASPRTSPACTRTELYATFIIIGGNGRRPERSARGPARSNSWATRPAPPRRR
jgi:hypothetical protein